MYGVRSRSTASAYLAQQWTPLHSPQVTKQATVKAAEEAEETKGQFQDSNATMATYKASQATWKASQAAEAAGNTENCANQAASDARQARTSEALDYALSAAQYYNEVWIFGCLPRFVNMPKVAVMLRHTHLSFPRLGLAFSMHDIAYCYWYWNFGTFVPCNAFAQAD